MTLARDLRSWNSIRRLRRTQGSTATLIIKSALSHWDERLRAREEEEGGEVKEAQQRAGALWARWFMARCRPAPCTRGLAVRLERDPAEAVTIGNSSSKKLPGHLLHHLCSSAPGTHLLWVYTKSIRRGMHKTEGIMHYDAIIYCDCFFASGMGWWLLNDFARFRFQPISTHGACALWPKETSTNPGFTSMSGAL